MGMYKKETRALQQVKEAAFIIGLVKQIKEEQPCISVRKLQVIMKDDLNKQGIKIGRDGLFDLLREFSMLVKTRRYRHYRTDSTHHFKKYPNRSQG